MNQKASVSKELNARHSKILEGFLKLPENRECADCQSSFFSSEMKFELIFMFTGEGSRTNDVDRSSTALWGVVDKLERKLDSFITEERQALVGRDDGRMVHRVVTQCRAQDFPRPPLVETAVYHQ
ncbi:hypothetical protein Dsin_019285 [Dipteronia sinensis]|uniref:Uncharacterized protein n=1 Tax=Dipteronia sinensis TaxID=43782 RepID=A0AAE0A7P1_9ROSI|nr:hypothetical protein Dsin_019285 [Dipteronia sinensis]